MPSENSPNVTLNDIARRLRISIGAVSRALNNYPGVGKPLAEKIKATAQEMGYQYHPFKSKRSDTVGLILAVREEALVLPSYTSKLLVYLDRITQKSNKFLLVHMVSPEHYKDQLKNIISNRRADGLLISGLMPREFFADLRTDGVPAVVLNDSAARTGCSAVINNPFDAIEELLSRLHRLGHRQVVNVLGNRKYTITNRRYEAWMSAVHKLGFNPDPKLVLENIEPNLKGARDCTQALLKMKPMPTAIIFPSDTMTTNVCAELRLHGIQIPKDISIAAFENDSMGESMMPPLTIIDVKLPEVTQAAYKELMNLITTRSDDVIQKEISASLVWRASCGKCRGNS